MRIKVPEYFVSFNCIADKCSDSCCIGWEIDVDEAARAKYETLSTPLGKEICEKTAHGCFPLCKNRRCAFLDDKGLCRIISALGDGYLCDICREHPRYYGVGSDGIEGGLGLGCEEAARMILSLEGLPRLIEIDRDIPYYDEDEYASVSECLRELLYGEIFNLNVYEIVGKYKAYANIADDVAFEVCAGGKPVPIPKVTLAAADNEEIEKLLADMLSLLSECEVLTENWCSLIDEARKVKVENAVKREKELRALLYYFTHRYVREGVADMSLGARVLFALGSALFVTALSEVIKGDKPEIRASVMYSKNVEYSTENVNIILDGLSQYL